MRSNRLSYSPQQGWMSIPTTLLEPQPACGFSAARGDDGATE